MSVGVRRYPHLPGWHGTEWASIPCLRNCGGVTRILAKPHTICRKTVFWRNPTTSVTEPPCRRGPLGPGNVVFQNLLPPPRRITRGGANEFSKASPPGGGPLTNVGTDSRLPPACQSPATRGRLDLGKRSPHYEQHTLVGTPRSGKECRSGVRNQRLGSRLVSKNPKRPVNRDDSTMNCTWAAVDGFTPRWQCWCPTH